MSTSIRQVVIVDDHPVLLAGICALVDASGDYKVVGQATSGTSGLALIMQLKPDLAVVDLSMPGMNGIELVTRLSRALPSTMAVVLTAHEEPSYVQEAIRAGARGYVLKRSAADELVRALKAVVASGLYIDPAVAARVMNSLKKPTSGAGELSGREKDVVQAAARGFSNKEVALRMELSVKTIETYKARAMEKLKLHSRSDLVRHAAAQGWILDHENIRAGAP